MAEPQSWAGWTTAKPRSHLRLHRPPTYVSRETGAAELDMSVDTWDAMVRAGHLPPAIYVGIAGTTPRWRWADVDAKLSAQGKAAETDPEPFFREHSRGATKERRRGTA